MPKFLKLSNSEAFAIVDINCPAKISDLQWRLNTSGYPVTGTQTFLHKMVLGISAKGHRLVVDHINGNKLDNRKSNLRICSEAENALNRGLTKSNKTGFKGVVAIAEHKFRSVITLNYKQFHLGFFADPEDAARTYDKAAKELHGDFARLNFPEESVEVSA